MAYSTAATSAASYSYLASLTSLGPETLLQLNNIASIGNTLGLTTQIALSLAIAFSPGDVGHLLAATFIKMQQFIKYISIYYTVRLELVLYSTKLNPGLLGVGPDMPLDLLISLTYPRLTLTGRFGLSLFPRFIMNFWYSLFIIVVSTILWLLSWLAERLTKKPEKGHQPYIITRRVRITFQNFLIAQIYCNFADILIFSILEFKGTEFYKGIDFLSLALAILFILIGVAILVRHILLMVQYKKLNKNSLSVQDRKALSQYKTNHEGLKIFFHSFKDASFTHQLFLFLFIFRLILLGIFLGCLIESPQVQAIIMLALTLLLLIFTIIRRPFKEIINFVQYLVFEIVFLAVTIFLVILSTLDAKLDLNPDLRDPLCGILLLMGLIFCGISHIFLLVKLIIGVLKFMKSRNQANQPARAPAINLNTTQDNLIDLNNSRSPARRDPRQPRPSKLRADRDRTDVTFQTSEAYEMSSPTDVDRSSPRRKGSTATKGKKGGSPGRREKEYQASDGSNAQNNSRIEESQIIEVDDEEIQTRPRQRSVGVRQNQRRQSRIVRGMTMGENEDSGHRGDDRNQSRVFNKKIDKKDYKGGKIVNKKKEIPPEVSFRSRVQEK